MEDVFYIAGFVILVVAMIGVGIWLGKSRCPSCRKFFAGRVIGSSEVASVDTMDWGYDAERGEHRNIPTHRTGHLIKRSCRYCENTWDRIETSARQLDRLTPEQGEEYRDRKLF